VEPDDEIPEGSFKILHRPRTKAAPWVLPVLVPGFLALAACAFAAGHGALDGFAESRAYTAAPHCAIPASANPAGSTAAPCPATDRIDETVTVLSVTTTSDSDGNDTTLYLVFKDPSGTVPAAFSDGSSSAEFSDGNLPPLDASASSYPDLQAEVYGGTLQWVRQTAGGPQYQSDGSVDGQTADAALPLLILSALDLVFSCFGWWLLVRRGASSDQDLRRPLLFLTVVIVDAVGWETCTHREDAGVAVYFAGMLLALFLAVPGVPRPRLAVPPPSSWPRLARTRWSDRGGKRGHDEIFR
jgi:hypothetical protein